jgi:DNA-binding MarR family transcriptional regulator
MWNKVINEISPKTSQFKVLVYLAFKGPSHPNEVSDETRISSGTVRPALRALLNKDFVDQLDDGSYRSLIPFTEIVSHLYLLNK